MRRRRTLITLAAVAALAAACAPERQARRTRDALPITLPDDWSAAPGDTAAPPPGWWRDFGGERLEALIIEAQLANPDVHATAARLAAADALVDVVGADRAPQLGVGLDRSRTRQVFIGLPIPGSSVASSTTDRYDLSLDASWEIDLWGRLAAAEGAAAGEAAAAAADLLAARLSLTGAVVRAWVGLVEADQQLRLAEANLDAWSSSRELVERRYRSGLRSAVDLRLLRASEAAAAARLATRGQARHDARRALELLLGRYPSADLLGGDALPELDTLAPAGLPALLLARRPDLAAAELRLAAAELRVDVARAAFYPRFALTGSYGTTTEHLDDLLDGDFRAWSLAGRLVQPLFEGGRLQARVVEADARAAEALALFTGSVLRACAEVETALDAEAWLAEREAELEVAARESRGGADLARDRYARGLLDVITLLETERGAQDAEIALLSVRRARLDARVDLILALGGGFDAAADMTADADDVDAVQAASPRPETRP